MMTKKGISAAICLIFMFIIIFNGSPIQAENELTDIFKSINFYYPLDDIENNGNMESILDTGSTEKLKEEINTLKELTEKQSEDIQTLKAIISELKYGTLNSTPLEYEETVAGLVTSNFGTGIWLNDGTNMVEDPLGNVGSKYYLRIDGNGHLQKLPPNGSNVKLYLDSNSKIVGWEIID